MNLVEALIAARIAGGGMSDAAKQLVLDCLDHVVWADDEGPELLADLKAAMFPKVYLYELKAEDFVVKNLERSSPYYSGSSTRLSYIGFDLTIQGGKTYRIKATCTDSGAKMGPQIMKTAGMEKVENEETYSTNDVYNPGWKDLDCTITAPADGACLRLTFKNANDTSLGAGFAVTRLTVKEVPASG